MENESENKTTYKYTKISQKIFGENLFSTIINSLHHNIYFSSRDSYFKILYSCRQSSKKKKRISEQQNHHTRKSSIPTQ